MPELKTFERESVIAVDPRELFEWHARPGAFERLVPPWERVKLIGPAAELRPGARQTMALRIGPAPVRWLAEITDVTAEPDESGGYGFVDRQLEGPFGHWEHTHSMVPADGEGRFELGDGGEPDRPDGGGARLIDRVKYALPFGPLGAPGGPFARGNLERMFGYRHRVTAADLARHAAWADRPRLDVLVSGASGMVGTALCAFLTTGGHRVRRLVRREPRGPDEFRWDPLGLGVDPAAAEGADAIVHLAGENIAGSRWGPAQKDRIRRSRREGTRQVADAWRAAKARPEVFVSASAVGIYGDRGDEELDESSAQGEGFLADVCRAWERASQDLSGPRTVQMRFGVILSPAGGALAKMLLPFKLGLGGRLGSGAQWMSWIALDDVVYALHRALHDTSLSGPVNTVAPGAVTNADYTRTLGKVLGRPAILPMPGFAARAAFGELADELLLAGQKVRPGRLGAAGFDFAYPELEGALRHQLGRA